MLFGCSHEMLKERCSPTDIFGGAIAPPAPPLLQSHATPRRPDRMLRPCKSLQWSSVRTRPLPCSFIQIRLSVAAVIVGCLHWHLPHHYMCWRESRKDKLYVQHLFREHLVKCLTERALSPFPTTSRSRKPLPQHGCTAVNMFCMCRLPEDGRMIQCDNWKEGYHRHWVSVPESVSSDSNSVWCCASC